MTWAKNKKEPFVIGALIKPSTILDLTTQEARFSIKNAYDKLSEIYDKQGLSLPANKAVSNTDKDLKNRKLDCLVMNHIQKTSPFDAIVAPFMEGNEIYKGAMFREHTHIQVAVRSADSILGYFIPKELNLK